MQKGFTIVELIIVIVVIGILAAIGIVSYNGTQKRAIDVSVQKDLEGAAGELESYRIRGGDANPNREFPRTKAQLDTLGIVAQKNAYNTSLSYNMIYCVANSGPRAYQEFKLAAQSKAGTIFMITQDGFQQHSLVESNLTATFCTSQGMGLVSNGLSAPNTWQSWVRSS